MSIHSTTVAKKPHAAAATTAHRIAAASPLQPSAYFRRKAVFDRVVAALLLLPGLPIIAVLVLLVRLTSRGPGMYRQARLGQGGRKFVVYKIRTMRHKAEADCGAVWTQPGDPRITPLGRILRKFHLDELPQLFNVLRGEMALIGPRPERPEFVHVLAESVPGYLDRLAVPPGITGLAQLNLPPDSDLQSVRRKLVLDCEYIRQAGLWLDVRLFLCTALRLVKVPELWLMPLFGLRRAAVLPTAPALKLHGEGGNGNGNGNGNGSEHAPTTVANLVHQAAAESAAGDGKRDHAHDHRHKEGHARHAFVKPR
jgi:lipopolysaccharide/colanic/teichoic acid biosynthesis glycosyltransferase